MLNILDKSGVFLYGGSCESGNEFCVTESLVDFSRVCHGVRQDLLSAGV